MAVAVAAVFFVLVLLSFVLAFWAFLGLVIPQVSLPSRRLCIPVGSGLVASFAAFTLLDDGAGSAGLTLLSLAAVVVLGWACVGLVSPRLARLPNRWMTAPLVLLSLVVLAVVGANTPPTEERGDARRGRSAGGSSVSVSDESWCGDYRAIRASAGGGSTFAQVRDLLGSPHSTMGGTYRWDLALFGDPVFVWVRFDASDRAVHKRHQGIVDLATGFDCWEAAMRLRIVIGVVVSLIACAGMVAQEQLDLSWLSLDGESDVGKLDVAGWTGVLERDASTRRLRVVIASRPGVLMACGATEPRSIFVGLTLPETLDVDRALLKFRIGNDEWQLGVWEVGTGSERSVLYVPDVLLGRLLRAGLVAVEVGGVTRITEWLGGDIMFEILVSCP